MSEKDKLYERAVRGLQDSLAVLPPSGEGHLRAFVDVTHKDSPTGLPHFWWCGSYLLRQGRSDDDSPRLELAAASSPACSPLLVEPRTGGVCSDCALIEKPVIVPDVASYPGHVACDPGARSEIAVPLFDSNGRLAGVIDVDSDEPGSFDGHDAQWLARIAEILSPLIRER